MSFSYSEVLDSDSALPRTHDNSVLAEKVNDCMVRFDTAKRAPMFCHCACIAKFARARCDVQQIPLSIMRLRALT
jgi:hypothetical protein